MKKKFNKTKPTEHVRIVMTEQTKEKIKPLQEKYKISLSTFTENLANIYVVALPTQTIENMKKTYLFNDGKETHIKPRKLIYQFKEKQEKTKFLSNLLYLYANDEIKNIIVNQKLGIKAKSLLDKKLKESKECYWNLNNIIRTNKRALRMLGVLDK